MFGPLTRVFVGGAEIDSPLPRRGRKLVFIDGGARKGEAYDWNGQPDCGVMDLELNVDIHRDRMPIPFPNLKGAEIHMFEPNTRMWVEERHETAKQISRFAEAVYVHSVAIWNSNESKEFYVGVNEDWGDVGSTLVRDKKEDLDLESPLQVQCIDIAEFIKNNFVPQDIVLFKLDIEGAEYDVLPALLKDEEAMNVIKSLYVEWHHEFVPQELLSKMPEIALQINYWTKKNGLSYAVWPY